MGLARVVLLKVAVFGPLTCVQAYPETVPSESVPEPLKPVLLVGRVIEMSLPAFAIGALFPLPTLITSIAETFGFSMYQFYEEKFGEEFERNTVHCIESGSNINGWDS